MSGRKCFHPNGCHSETCEWIDGVGIVECSPGCMVGEARKERDECLDLLKSVLPYARSAPFSVSGEKLCVEIEAKLKVERDHS